MTNIEQIAHSLLPRAEGLLLGTIGGLEIENFNREGAAKTLTDAIALLHKVRLLLEPQLNSEQKPLLPQADVLSSAVVEVCYRWPDGREEVRYRRDVGTADANDLIAEVDEMQSKQGDKCPYFYRIA